MSVSVFREERLANSGCVVRSRDNDYLTRVLENSYTKCDGQAYSRISHVGCPLLRHTRLCDDVDGSNKMKPSTAMPTG